MYFLNLIILVNIYSPILLTQTLTVYDMNKHSYINGLWLYRIMFYLGITSDLVPLCVFKTH